MSVSDIKPCIEIDKPLLVYIFSKDVHNNVAYVMTKYYGFTPKMWFLRIFNVTLNKESYSHALSIL